MNSLQKNIYYKGLLTFSNYVLGFITFPYITRVLGPENFGLVNFSMNTVDYFLLFATMGITTIGTREIAGCKNNRDKLDITYSQVLGINGLFTFITLLIYFICLIIVPKFSAASELLYIGSAKILFTLFAVEWLFTGLEEFRYITIRSLIIKIIYVIVVFVCVKDKTDYLLYFILTIGVVVVNSLVNFGYASKLVSVQINQLRSIRFLKQNMRLGGYAIMTSMYITFNVMYLGLVSSNEEVGYYSAAVKLYFIAISLFGAFTSVMLPRISSLVVIEDKVGIQRYMDISFRMVMLMAIPIILIGMIFAPEIIYILSGNGYDASILPMRIIMPAIILVWSALVMVYLGLIPLHRDDILLKAAIVGGLLAIALNIVLTPRLGSIGSALVLLICEMCVTLFYIIRIKRSNLFKLPQCSVILKALYQSFPYIGICFFARFYFDNFTGLFVALLGCGIYFLYQNPIKQIRAV